MAIFTNAGKLSTIFSYRVATRRNSLIHPINLSMTLRDRYFSLSKRVFSDSLDRVGITSSIPSLLMYWRIAFELYALSPASASGRLSFLNVLIRQAFMMFSNSGRISGVFFCAKTNYGIEPSVTRYFPLPGTDQVVPSTQ